MSAPDSVCISELLEIEAGIERGVGVGAPPTGMAGSLPPFEEQRFAEFYSGSTAEMRCTTKRGSGDRVAPQEKPLRAGPHAEHDVIAPACLEEVAEPVAQKTS